MAVGFPTARRGKLFHHLRDRVEPVHDEMIPERLPALVFAILDANIKEDEWLAKEALTRHPLSKLRILVERQLHWLM
jgi:hypothetical protein